jgi:hypothetical protein
MTSKSQSTEEAKIIEVANELTQEQLDLVAGGTKTTSIGKLHEAATKGTHIPEVVIE